MEILCDIVNLFLIMSLCLLICDRSKDLGSLIIVVIQDLCKFKLFYKKKIILLTSGTREILLFMSFLGFRTVR